MKKPLKTQKTAAAPNVSLPRLPAGSPFKSLLDEIQGLIYPNLSYVEYLNFVESSKGYPGACAVEHACEEYHRLASELTSEVNRVTVDIYRATTYEELSAHLNTAADLNIRLHARCDLATRRDDAETHGKLTTPQQVLCIRTDITMMQKNATHLMGEGRFQKDIDDIYDIQACDAPGLPEWVVKPDCDFAAACGERMCAVLMVEASLS